MIGMNPFEGSSTKVVVVLKSLATMIFLIAVFIETAEAISLVLKKKPVIGFTPKDK